MAEQEKGLNTKYKLAASIKECMKTTPVDRITVKDIVEGCGLARQTFYRNFKDKYDLRDKLIVEHARNLFDKASVDLDKEELNTLEDKVIFIADHVINELNDNKILLRFISKNLSWGVFHDMLVTGGEDDSGFTFLSLIHISEPTRH